MQIPEQAKPIFEVGAIGTVAGAAVGWLPHLAALLGVIWWLIRIYETETVKKLLNKWRKKK